MISSSAEFNFLKKKYEEKELSNANRVRYHVKGDNSRCRDMNKSMYNEKERKRAKEIKTSRDGFFFPSRNLHAWSHALRSEVPMP